MKVEDPSALLVQWFYHKPQYLPKGDESSWQNHTRFAARNATTIKTFIVTAKTNMGTRNIFAAYAGINLRRTPLRPAGAGDPRIRSYPVCPVCGKAIFLHHDHKYYSNYQRCDKKCGHFIFVPKPSAISTPSMSKLFGKTDFKRMRYPMHIILTALSMFYMGKNSFRNIALILRTVMNIRVSHTAISNWCTKFAPLFYNISLQLIPTLNFRASSITSG